MNKKVFLLIFIFVIAWNLTFFMLRDSVKMQIVPDVLEPDEKTDTSGSMNDIISVFNHETGKVIYMQIEDYIKCVLSAEMPVSYGLEALKAQAVAARTYTLYCLNNKSEKHPNADVCTNYKHCQAFKSKDDAVSAFSEGQYDIINEAVEQTKGEILLYNGEIINAVYHASSCDFTENAKNVWGSDVPYLLSVSSPAENSMSGFESKLSISLTGFFEKLRLAGYSGDFARGSIDTCINESGRVLDMIVGKNDDVPLKVPGSVIRNLFSLRSTCFDFIVDGDNIIFKVRGYGHGVGMSQYGAKIMAQKGSTYDSILLHYYSGCSIENIYK